MMCFELEGPDDLGLIYSRGEVDAILSAGSTPPSLQAALAAGKTLRRVKRDSIYTTLRWGANAAAASVTQLAPDTYRGFNGIVGQANTQGFVPATTFADTNIIQSGTSPFSGLFVARRLNVYIWSTQGPPGNNQADEAVELLVFHTPLTFEKGSSFKWTVGALQKCVNFRGNKLFSVDTGAVGFGIGDGYDLGIPWIVEPKESLACLLQVPAAASHLLTLPATYVVDVKIELDGDAVELVSQ